jgi:MFS family permease
MTEAPRIASAAAAGGQLHAQECKHPRKRLRTSTPGLLAAAAIIYAIRHTPVPRTRHTEPLRIRIRPVLHGQLGPLMAAIGCFEAGNAAATLLILRATQLLTPQHGSNTATTLALGLYVLYNLIATLASLPAGRAADRLGSGPAKVLAAGVTVSAAACAGFAAISANLLVLAVPFAAAGVAIGLAETAENVAVAPAHLRGSAFGLLATIQAAGNLAASAVAG